MGPLLSLVKGGVKLLREVRSFAFSQRICLCLFPYCVVSTIVIVNTSFVAFQLTTVSVVSNSKFMGSPLPPPKGNLL